MANALFKNPLANTNDAIGKVNIPTKFLAYTGEKTESTEVIINNELRTIGIKILKTLGVADFKIVKENNNIVFLALDADGTIIAKSIIGLADDQRLFDIKYDENNTCLLINPVSINITEDESIDL